ncbi:RING-H2 finger protein ATL46-like [Rutidosis leptorrhynchoides]|uniref:RING-H2 finger protein ATL46-like n=1 Tax=Rutidosis leptorrhynchoides TaxID=125765 RepID=UPI003A9A54FF
MDFRDERWVSRHTHVKMSWMKYEIYKMHALDSSPSYSPPFSDHTIHKTSIPSSSLGTKISPTILFIIIILAVLFFISGLLHLLVKFLTKYHSSSNSYSTQPDRRYPNTSNSVTLQRQLQQLFNLHDSGLDQEFIDALPVFMYKEVVGAKESFDCAVCLCEFCEMDKLRLLPICSHAFHINCIDTWLQSNSTCPLCRNTLINPVDNPVFEFDDMKEEDEIRLAPGQKTNEHEQMVAEKGVLLVRLGKFRRLTEGENETGETSSRKLDARRCYSMGSYEYVVGDTSLKLALNQKRVKKDSKIEEGNENVNNDTEGKKISISAKTDSYSVSKIWLWSKNGKLANSSENQMHNPSSVDMELPWMSRI